MRAAVLEGYGKAEDKPLKILELKDPKPSRNQILIEISVCGVCRTDLHVIERELAPRKLPIIPGHQIVGTVADVGAGVKGIKKGERVGVTWMNSTCGKCEFCRSGRENLCERMQLTGYDVDGGYAEYVVVDQDFAFKVPEGIDDVHAAPLFCAGIIGYRALKLSGIRKGQTLAIFGFGASGHISAQIAKHWGVRLIVFTRGKEHQQLARRYGAVWAGESSDKQTEMADAAIITAPSGGLVIDALRNVKKGGRVAIQDIYMSKIPEIDYNRYLYYERWVGSTANYTRQDAKEFLDLAADIPIKTQIERFELEDSNKALLFLKQGKINGAGVLKIK